MRYTDVSSKPVLMLPFIQKDNQTKNLGTAKLLDASFCTGGLQ